MARMPILLQTAKAAFGGSSEYRGRSNRVYTSALNGKANQNAVDEQTDKLNQNDPGSALSQALAKCIPTTQVNATGLYETLERHEDAYTGGNPNPSGSSYTDASWENFTTNYENAKELLDSLFYQEGDAIPEGKEAGDATPANTTGRQRDLENAAAVLNAARSDLFLTDYVEILPLWQSAADWLLEQQAKLTAADYTPDSWSAWYNVEDKDENGIGDGAIRCFPPLIHHRLAPNLRIQPTPRLWPRPPRPTISWRTQGDLSPSMSVWRIVLPPDIRNMH